MKLIVGLGNPGPKYAGTRHNVGFAVIDLLADRWKIDMSREKFHAWYGDGVVADERVVLMKPTTLMNRSGDAVLSAGRFYQVEKQDLMVIMDDWALPLGHIRVRSSGSAGSHNGLENVIDRIGFSDFPRLRLGIGEPLGNPVSYVLTKFTRQESEAVQPALNIAAEAVACWVEQGTAAAMNRFNRKSEQQQGE
ncbi:MAG: aminoacyl-tRNA hydrolase [Phycisphaerae bacterium]